MISNSEKSSLQKEAEPTENEELEYILDYVKKIRVLNNLEPSQDVKMEISCNAYPGGEIAHLLERQLVTTNYGEGCWREVMGENGTTVRKKVVNLIKRIDNA